MNSVTSWSETASDSATPPIIASGATAASVEQALDRLSDLNSQLEAGAASPPASSTELPVAGFRLSVVIPVYNEENTILEIVRQVCSLPFSLEVIVVDDHSTDSTPDKLQTLNGDPAVRILRQPRNMGKGAALRSGFAAATGEIVVVQDADLEYDPRDIPGLLAPILAGEADVVYGSRFLHETPVDRSWLHRFGNGLLTRTSNLLTGLALTDMETCYKAFRRETLAGLPLRQNRFGFEPEITARLARRGYRFAERPIGYSARTYAEGKKIGLKDAFNALYCIVRYGLFD